MQWIYGPSQSNVDNLNNARLVASRHFSKKKKAYMKAKIGEIKANSKIKILGNCTGASMTLRRVTSLELIQ